MNLPFEIPDMDWSNFDVRKIVEIIGSKYVQKRKRIKTYEKRMKI